MRIYSFILELGCILPMREFSPSASGLIPSKISKLFTGLVILTISSFATPGAKGPPLGYSILNPLREKSSLLFVTSFCIFCLNSLNDFSKIGLFLNSLYSANAITSYKISYYWFNNLVINLKLVSSS